MRERLCRDITGFAVNRFLTGAALFGFRNGPGPRDAKSLGVRWHLRVMANTHAQAERSIEADRRAAARTRHTRRRRIIRDTVTFIIAVAVMVMLSMAHRDSQAVRASRDSLGHLTAELQEAYERGSLPAKLPTPNGLDSDEALAWRDRLIYLRGNIRKKGENHQLVAIVYADQPLSLFLRADGRHLIVFDGKKFERIWMTERELQQRKDELCIFLPE